jgi:hypothetical protein
MRTTVGLMAPRHRMPRDGLCIGNFAGFFRPIVAETPGFFVTIPVDSFQNTKNSLENRLMRALPGSRQCLQISRQKWYRAAIISSCDQWM